MNRLGISQPEQWIEAILLIGFWIFEICLAGVMARSKRRASSPWRIATFLLGPIALLVLWFIPFGHVEEEQLSASSPDARPARTCPYCIAVIPAIASVCRYCLRESPAQPPPTAAVAT